MDKEPVKYLTKYLFYDPEMGWLLLYTSLCIQVYYQISNDYFQK